MAATNGPPRPASVRRAGPPIGTMTPSFAAAAILSVVGGTNRAVGKAHGARLKARSSKPSAPSSWPRPCYGFWRAPCAPPQAVRAPPALFRRAPEHHAPPARARLVDDGSKLLDRPSVPA